MTETDYTDFAEYLADEARKISNEFFRLPVLSETKKDNSPVTEADQKIEKTLRQIIRNNFPEHGIYGEEFGLEGENNEYVWYIDPIDGTKSFMSGRSLFGTLLALTHNNVPIVGIIDQPIINERWIGAHGATKFNNQIIKTRSCEISNAILGTTSPDMFKNDSLEKFQKIANSCRFTMYGGDCYTYGQLAMGLVDVVIEDNLKPYDFMALIPIIENAGGVITDWKGELLTASSKGDVIACGDSELHSQIIKMLN